MTKKTIKIEDTTYTIQSLSIKTIVQIGLHDYTDIQLVNLILEEGLCDDISYMDIPLSHLTEIANEIRKLTFEEAEIDGEEIKAQAEELEKEKTRYII